MTYPVLVYIAGPFSAPTRAGVDQNIREAIGLGLRVAALGAFPVIPHSNTAHPQFELVQPYHFWIAGTLALLRACGACIMVEGWEKSSGARGERDEMIRLGRPVFYSIEELEAWLGADKQSACNCNPLARTGGGHAGDCPEFEPECTCYELTGGHQPGCWFNAIRKPGTVMP